MAIKTLKNFKLKNKKVLLRLDLNSPVVDGKVEDSPRIKEGAETIELLAKEGAKIAVIAHQGRKGDRDFVPLVQHADLLKKYTSASIEYVDDLFSQTAQEKIDSLKPGQTIILKNVREFDDEKNLKDKNNRYKSLCKLFDVYINDAFSVCHREQGSIILTAKYLPSCMGPHLQKEVESIKKFDPKSSKKGIFFIGGQKIEDYIPIFNVLKNKKNIVIASGVLANLFYVSIGKDLGYENTTVKANGQEPLIPILKKLYKKYPQQIILPIDFAIGDPDIKKATTRIEATIENAPFKEKIWDIGSKSIEIYKKHLSNADTVFMKGPLGYSELPQFSKATVEILSYISKVSKENGVFSLLGGGHLTTSIQKYNIQDNFSHISTSGGALIAFISGEKLPGIEVLKKIK